MASVAARRGSIPQPQDGINALEGLLVMAGYKCCMSSCYEKSTSEKRIKQHCRDSHKWSLNTRGWPPAALLGPRPELPCQAVHLQTLWAEKKHIAYFVVQRAAIALTPGFGSCAASPALHQLHGELDRLEAGDTAIASSSPLIA